MQLIKAYFFKGFIWTLLAIAYAANIQAQIQVALDASGKLSVDATNQADTIITQLNGGQFKLITKSENGKDTYSLFPAAAIKYVWINSYGGADTIIHLSAIDSTILTASGEDYVYSSNGKNIIELGPQNDIAYFLDGENWVQSEAGSDLLWGGAGDDHFWGGTDDDLLLGGGDDDVLIGSGGNDFLSGDSGNDYIQGDRFSQPHGSDFLLGGPGKDQLDGFAEDDILCGGGQDDLLLGGAGDDLLFGETGADHHDGYAGNDELYGNPNLGDTFINGNVNVSDLLCSEIIETINESMQMAASGDQLLAVSDGQSYLQIAGTNADDEILIQSFAGEVVIHWPSGPLQDIHFQLENDIIDLILEADSGNDVIEIEGEFSSILVSDRHGDDQLQLVNAAYQQLILIDHQGNDEISLGSGKAFVSPGPGNDYVLTGQGSQLIDNNDEDTIEGQSDGVTLLSQVSWEQG